MPKTHNYCIVINTLTNNPKTMPAKFNIFIN